MTAFLLFLLPQIAPPVKPAADFDPASAASVVEHVAYNTRTSKSYEAGWKARLTVPRSDPLDYIGRCVWVRPGVLYSHYTASGGDEKMIVRAGDKDVWVYNTLVGWVTADEAGMAGAGRGIQNPDEVLAVLARNSGTAKLVKPGQVELEFKGENIERIMREQGKLPREAAIQALSRTCRQPSSLAPGATRRIGSPQSYRTCR